MFKLALSAGHGINTAGRRCSAELDPNETREWWLNDRVCDYVEELLQGYDGYSLLRLDDSDDGEDDVSLKARVDAANEWGAHFFLSIHHNAGANGTAAGGITAFTHPQSSTESVVWRNALYRTLVQHTGLSGNRANPLSTADFYVLRETDMPAVLLELGFMDSTSDVPEILREEFARNCAAAIVEVIAARGKLTKKDEPQEEQGGLYRVQVGVFRSLKKAQALQEELESKGYKVYISRV